MTVQQRWTFKRKTQVVLEVRNEELTISQACAKYDLDEYELRDWIFKHGHFGPASLRMNTSKEHKRRNDDEINERSRRESSSMASAS